MSLARRAAAREFRRLAGTPGNASALPFMNPHSTIGPRLSSVATLWAILVAALLGSVGPRAWSAPSRLQPYLGEVEGVVLSDLTLQNPTASASVRSHPLGPGVQTFEQLSLEMGENAGWTLLSTRGVAVTTQASGEELRIAFDLEGVFVGPTSVQYTGTFVVIPGGTGPFLFAGWVGDLGRGWIAGQAEVIPNFLTGTLEYRFHHLFGGTLRIAGGGRAR